METQDAKFFMITNNFKQIREGQLRPSLRLCILNTFT